MLHNLLLLAHPKTRVENDFDDDDRFPFFSRGRNAFGPVARFGDRRGMQRCIPGAFMHIYACVKLYIFSKKAVESIFNGGLCITISSLYPHRLLLQRE